MASEGNRDVPNEALSMEQSSTSGAKRKRGRPRKYENTTYELPQRAQPIQSVPPLHSTQGVACTASPSSAPLLGNSGKDDILGKHFVGKMTKKFPGVSLITVKVKDNQVLRGWVPDENDLRPITPKDDLAPELPMLRLSQVRKRASAIHMQTAPTVPIHLEDVTLAKPLQMRRPVEKTIAKHTVPLAPRTYMGSGVIAAVPVSVSPSNAETRTLAKQDTEFVIQPPSVAAVPFKPIRPVLVSCKQMANQNDLVGEKSVNEFQKDSESSNGTKESSVKAEKPNTALVDVVVKGSPGERKLRNVQVTDAVRESSGQTQHADTTVIDETKIASGARDQPNSANSEHQSSKEPSDIKEQTEQLKTDWCPERS
ncbi:uncharacterized protein LOC133925040 isoform X4 [Phragmites australis]|uniref:uncharacterized protein LOC133925040 isoform X4 n=1 Tax=Phragmites australis TaxID=29695 RepID=UPI002D795618|nr:uncharacterized protein LOC133925040 isoform X4 [Phragmites australis]